MRTLSSGIYFDVSGQSAVFQSDCSIRVFFDANEAVRMTLNVSGSADIFKDSGPTLDLELLLFMKAGNLTLFDARLSGIVYGEDAVVTLKQVDIGSSKIFLRRGLFTFLGDSAQIRPKIRVLQNTFSIKDFEILAASGRPSRSQAREGVPEFALRSLSSSQRAILQTGFDWAEADVLS